MIDRRFVGVTSHALRKIGQNISVDRGLLYPPTLLGGERGNGHDY